MGIITLWWLNGVSKMSRKSILKQVYFNPQNPKELELLVYYEDKFSSFGGIVKDLLYKQMMLEKGNVNVTYTTSTEKVIDNKEKEESYSTEMYVDKDDVSDFDC